MTESIPANFIQTMHEVYGAPGDAWIARLPGLLDALAARWGLRVQPPYPLSYNYVAPATRADGAPVVLKCGYPNSELASEMAALAYYDGRGIARLLEKDERLGAMLLERVQPGTPLAEMEDDEQATRIIAEVMRQLWRPIPENAGAIHPSAAGWAKGLGRLRETFGGGAGPFPTRLVEQAEALFAELLASSAEPVLLHGDLHHWNVLAAERSPWLALDPKGLIGEPAYEIGALMRNRWLENAARADLLRQADRRIAIVAETLELDPRRLRGWTVAQGVLSDWWTYEDHHRVETFSLEYHAMLAEAWF